MDVDRVRNRGDDVAKAAISIEERIEDDEGGGQGRQWRRCMRM